MKHLNKILLIISLFFVSFSCNNLVKVTSIETVSGIYNYTGYDKNDILITKGNFNITVKDSTEIIGDWHFEKMNNSQNCGPQYGSGNLVGNITNSQIWIGLNPNNADNNIELIGTIEENKFSGNWNYISFIGITNSGKFYATKVKVE